MAGRSNDCGRGRLLALPLLLAAMLGAAMLGAPLAFADDLTRDGSSRRPTGPGFEADFVNRLLRFRDNVDYRFRDRILSPLSDAERRAFQGLDYFEPVPELALTALFERADDRGVFAMPTFDRRTLRYSHYGTLNTSLGDRSLRLKAFRREEADGNRNVLLVPFRDATNGNETYAGGRYIELPLPLPEAPVLDFNRAMNPLCAYDPSYACPIPPPENALEMPIRAGEKRYKPAAEAIGS